MSQTSIKKGARQTNVLLCHSNFFCPLKQKKYKSFIKSDFNYCVAFLLKVRKGAKISNRYNQVPHLTQDTTWESDKNIIKQHKREPRG